MFKLLDPKNVLEHLVELFFAQNQLRGCAGCHPGLLLPGVLFSSVDGIKLGHPGAQHCLLAKAIDLWQAAHPFLNVLLEDLPRVIGGAAPTLHHAGHAVTLQEHLSKNRARKGMRKSVLQIAVLRRHRRDKCGHTLSHWLPLCLLREVTQVWSFCLNLENENNNSTYQVVARINEK